MNGLLYAPGVRWTTFWMHQLRADSGADQRVCPNATVFAGKVANLLGAKGVMEAKVTCPRCAQVGVAVDRITLKALLTADGLRRGVPAAPRFCSTSDCPVVYFDAESDETFSEAELIVRVHAKHPDDANVLVCYCFDVTPAAMTREQADTGAMTMRAMVAHEVQAGHCACEVKNPKGACCLGDLVRIERALAQLQPTATCESDATNCCAAS